MRLLLAEDNRVTRRTMEASLEKLGYEVVTASDGDEAWEILRREDCPSLVLLDWIMPGFTGPELCEKVRARKSDTYKYIIMLTGKSDTEDIVEGLKSGADDYLTKPVNMVELEMRLRAGERIVEGERKLQGHLSQHRDLLEALPLVFITIGLEEEVTQWNRRASEIFGIEREDVLGRTLSESGIKWDREQINVLINDCFNSGESAAFGEVAYERPDGNAGHLDMAVMEIYSITSGGVLMLASEITARKQLESRLRQAQKLESIGQLAAGIAHEINTPTQYVGDNTRFLQDVFGDIQKIFEKDKALVAATAEGEAAPFELVKDLAGAMDSADLSFIEEEVPKAIEQSLDGVGRVAEIVKAMKEFAHPGVSKKVDTDINQAIRSTITIARNEWKYVAQVELDLADSLPNVPCMPGEFNQVILNMIVNASHAIKDRIDEKKYEAGEIVISTRQVGEQVEIRIADNGGGVPEKAVDKIFDPFFTTKDVGKGTGQGLAISHSVIVDKHGGEVELDNSPGEGATFILRLPLYSTVEQEV